jgi:hypothetical protein
MNNEKENKIDWRVGVCVKLKDFDKKAFPNWKVGDELVTCSNYQIGKDNLTFLLPNSTALMLNISKVNYNSAISLKANALTVLNIIFITVLILFFKKWANFQIKEFR